MLFLPVAIVLLAMFHARARADRGHGQHVLSRLRPSGCGGVAGVVFRDADPVSDRGLSGETSSGGFVSIRRTTSSSCFMTCCMRGIGLELGLVAAAAVIAAASLGIGYAIFKSQEDKMVFRL